MLAEVQMPVLLSTVLALPHHLADQLVAERVDEPHADALADRRLARGDVDCTVTVGRLEPRMADQLGAVARVLDSVYDDVDDLADLFLDMKANLESDVSPCWVLVPGTRSPGYVTADVIKDAAETAGLMATTSVAVGAAWMGVKLTAKGPRR